MSDARPPLPELRATPEEREHAIARCSSAFARDVLPLEEYEERLAALYRATTIQQIEAVTRDLPVEVETGGVPDARTLLPPLIDVMLGSVERSGRVVVPMRLEVRAVLGNIELDLHDAHFGTGTTVIDVNAILGNVELTLPADVAIENHGHALLGNFESTGGAAPASRTVRIIGRAFLGNVEVTTALSK